MCRRVHVAIPNTPAGPAEARHELSQQLEDLGQEVLDDLALIVSELATNALEARAQVIDVGVWVHHCRVELIVTDSAPGIPAPDGQEDEVRGRGLRIVEAVADSWGVRPLPTGKALVSTLAIPRPPPPQLADCPCQECSCRT
jgi:anti-sigma regulatory factor (Ser/Thr protein kinase)